MDYSVCFPTNVNRRSFQQKLSGSIFKVLCCRIIIELVFQTVPSVVLSTAVSTYSSILMATFDSIAPLLPIEELSLTSLSLGIRLNVFHWPLAAMFKYFKCVIGMPLCADPKLTSHTRCNTFWYRRVFIIKLILLTQMAGFSSSNLTSGQY